MEFNSIYRLVAEYHVDRGLPGGQIKRQNGKTAKLKRRGRVESILR